MPRKPRYFPGDYIFHDFSRDESWGSPFEDIFHWTGWWRFCFDFIGNATSYSDSNFSRGVWCRIIGIWCYGRKRKKKYRNICDLSQGHMSSDGTPITKPAEPGHYIKVDSKPVRWKGMSICWRYCDMWSGTRFGQTWWIAPISGLGRVWEPDWEPPPPKPDWEPRRPTG